MAAQWTVLVPLKSLVSAKSRLRGAMPELPHETLVRSLAQATLTAVAGSELVSRVILISDEADFEVERWPDSGASLNELLREAAGRVRGPVAAMPADLPALRSFELTEALTLAGRHKCFVPDAEGDGTVLLAAPLGDLDPHFGVGSAAAHERSGARRLPGDWPTLRRDVDTPEDLSRALRLGWRSPLLADKI